MHADICVSAVLQSALDNVEAACVKQMRFKSLYFG